MRIRSLTLWVVFLSSIVLLTALARAEDAQPPEDDAEAIFEHARAPWRGDLDGMIERGTIRFLTVVSLTTYFLDGIDQRGPVHDLVTAFESQINKTLPPRERITAVIVPVTRDRLLLDLIEGRGDIATANLTITPDRQSLVDFSDPLLDDVSELVVTGPAAAVISSLDDLVSVGLQLRRSSSYFEHLAALNTERERSSKPAIPVTEVDENLEDEDLLQMMNAGLVPAIVVDSHKAAFWKQIFDNIVVHEDLALNTGGQIAWAFRKDSPRLAAEINAFVKTAKKGTLLGNTVLKRYFRNTEWVENALGKDELAKFDSLIGYLKTYAGQYDFDWLMIGAQAYQESRLDQSKRSPVGAVGVMQVMPATAGDPNVGVPDIHQTEPNIHAGVKYLRFLRDRYFSDPKLLPVDRTLFSFAAYNAGPGNIAKARKRAEQMGFDPNIWFGNVEVAAAKTISREPVHYVRNIYKYYIAYRSITKYGNASLGQAAAGAEDAGQGASP